MDDIDDGMIASSNAVATLTASEIDQQIATAHKYPRSVSRFRKNVQQMVTLSDSIAAECIYSLPRDGKIIEGPSARFAEVVVNAWGNSRAGARIISDEGEFVTAQAVFHDLEANVAITYEVQRRITGKNGKRYSADMIGVTANAACSIALRNVILKGVPKAFWAEMYEGAKMMAKGDVETLPNRRAAVLKALLGYGVSPEQVYAKLGIDGQADITLDHLLLLRGLTTAIKEGDTTVEQAFETEGNGKPPLVVPRKSDTPPEKTVESEERPTVVDADGVITDTPVDSSMATGGEIQLLKSRIKSKGLDILTVLDNAGVTRLDDPMTLAGLSKQDFLTLKGVLA